MTDVPLVFFLPLLKVGSRIESIKILTARRHTPGSRDRRSSLQQHSNTSNGSGSWYIPSPLSRKSSTSSLGGGGGGYIVYEIQVKAKFGDLSWVVHRRYNNFVELHRTLPPLPPGHDPPNPPILPGKKIFNNTTEKFIRERLIKLEDYLQQVFEIGSLRNSEAFLTFIAAERIIEVDEMNQQPQQSYTSFPYAFRSTRGIAGIPFNNIDSKKEGDDCVIL